MYVLRLTLLQNASDLVYDYDTKHPVDDKELKPKRPRKGKKISAAEEEPKEEWRREVEETPCQKWRQSGCPYDVASVVVFLWSSLLLPP